MSRPFAPNLRASLEAWKSDEVYLILLSITHPELSGVLRLANNNEDVTSNGKVFQGFPFSIEPPSETDSPPQASVTIQNVDRRIGIEILKLRYLQPPKAMIQVVLASNPNTVWLEYRNFYLRNIQGNAMQITANLDSWDFGREPWPARRATKDRYPSLFR